MSTARNINSAKPFRRSAEAYRERGWLGVLPLPPKKKDKPPRGYTGRAAPYPDDGDIEEWIRDPAFINGNVCLHLGPIDEVIDGDPDTDEGSPLEIIGIDVDHYDNKVGYDQLLALEAELGPLPPTWVSTSRDGHSGIRFFLVPAGLAWVGKAERHIDIIQKCHRYAVVWPSWHPDEENRQYVWRNQATGELVAAVDDLPYVSDLPTLPEAWVKRLTQGGMTDTGDAYGELDMSSTVEELYTWASATFPKGEPCDKMTAIAQHWCDEIDDDESSHDKIKDATWNILGYASEGHAGWIEALRIVEEHWITDVLKIKGKRSVEELKGEIFRSKTQGIRKFKSQIDAGSRRVRQHCTCYVPSEEEVNNFTAAVKREDTSRAASKAKKKRNSSVSGRSEGGDERSGSGKSDHGDGDRVGGDSPSHPATPKTLDGVDTEGYGLDANNGLGGYWPSGQPNGKAKAPAEYDLNDRGNGHHWADLYKDNMFFVPALNDWIAWTGRGWELGDGVAERSYKRVERRQRRYAEQLFRSAAQLKSDQDPDAAGALSDAKRMSAWATRSGNVGPIESALKSAAGRLSIDEAELNANPYVLGCKNGVLELMRRESDEALDQSMARADHLRDGGGDPDREPGSGGSRGRHDGADITVRPVARADLLTLSTGVDYVNWGELTGGEFNAESAAAADYWQSMVRSYFPNDDTRAYVQRLLGYTLLGDNRERIVVFLHGGTGTGKTTFLNAVMAAFGEYGDVVDLGIFRGDRQTNPALAAALPKRIITASEASQRNVLHADVFKRISGNDPISAELKYSNEQVKRVPSFVAWIATNSPPRIPGADAAVNARIRVIPMKVRQFGDTAMNARLRNERLRCAVLSWVVEGWYAYREDGNTLGPVPAEVRKESVLFNSQLSDVSEYLEERVAVAPPKMTARAAVNKWHVKDWPEEWRCSASGLYEDYVAWCGENRVPDRDILKRNAFGRQLSDYGHKADTVKISGRVTRMHGGLQLKGEDAPILKLHKDDADA